LKKREGIVLFAHGSREREWARPFEQLAAAVEKKTTLPVKLAFLEQMKPSLEEAISAFAGNGIEAIRVVPVFLAEGGHVREDLPRLVDAIGRGHPGLELRLERPIGERAEVIEAIAASISRR